MARRRRTARAWEPPDDQAITAAASEWLSHDVIRQDMLGIPKESTEAAIGHVLSLVDERRRPLKIARLRRVIDGHVDDSRRDRLLRDVRRYLPVKQGLVDTLERSSESGADAQHGGERSVEYKVQMPKADFLADAEAYEMNVSVQLADMLIFKESIAVADMTETEATPLLEVSHLDAVVHAVQAVVSLSEGRGVSSRVILLPRRPDFVQALTGQEADMLPAHGQLGQFHLGDWQGHHILKWPYWNCSSIAVVDPARFYARHGKDIGSTLSLTVEEPYVAEHQAWLAEAEKAGHSSAIKDKWDVLVVAAFQFRSRLGIGDKSTGARITLDLKTLGYAMLEGDTVFHTAGCSLLKDKPEVHYRLEPRIEPEDNDRSPCDVCKPQVID